MSDHQHDQTVCETHARSLLKGITDKFFEVAFDFVIFDAVLSRLIPSQLIAATSSLGIAILIESVCFGLGYFNERLWNKVQWGRQIRCDACQKIRKQKHK